MAHLAQVRLCLPEPVLLRLSQLSGADVHWRWSQTRERRLLSGQGKEAGHYLYR